MKNQGNLRQNNIVTSTRRNLWAEAQKDKPLEDPKATGDSHNTEQQTNVLHATRTSHATDPSVSVSGKNASHGPAVSHADRSTESLLYVVLTTLLCWKQPVRSSNFSHKHSSSDTVTSQNNSRPSPHY